MRAGVIPRSRSRTGADSLRVCFSRPPLARMQRLHALLQKGSYPNCRRLAEELEVSAKTVQRDIDFMRDQLEFPIDYSAAERGFFYTKPVVEFPSVQISEGELVALFVARRALEQYRGTAFEKPLGAAFGKLTASLPERIGFAWEEFDRAAVFRPGTQGSGVVDLQVFKAVSAATQQTQELEFNYRKPASRVGAPPERRRVQPLQLRCQENQWYLDAQDLLRGRIRTFVLGRMSRARNTKKRFSRPTGFSSDQFLAGSFGVFSGLEVKRLRLEFDPPAAPLVRERRWHPSQRLSELPDGRVELTLDVGISPEVERWLLGWGDQVAVLEPASLRQALAAATIRAARRHGATDAV